MVRVKVCGITRREDALAAVRFGADALGFVLSESPRKVAVETAQKIMSAVPPFVCSVGVFVDEPLDFVKHVIDTCGIGYVQLHGEELPEYCDAIPRKVIKAFRVRGKESLAAIETYTVSAVLLDTYSSEAPGGTGKTFDWELARAAKASGKPLILSGGLNPENVASAIHQVAPYGVDVSSGIEASPGVKDHEKLQRFIARAKEVSSS